MKNDNSILSHVRFDSIGRRQFSLGLASLAAAMSLPNMSFAQSSAAAQKIADHFSSVKTMMGEFVQFGPRGE